MEHKLKTKYKSKNIGYNKINSIIRKKLKNIVINFNLKNNLMIRKVASHMCISLCEYAQTKET